MDPQNLMALGDGENDVEMLQVCIYKFLWEGVTSTLMHPSKIHLPCTVGVVWP